MTHEHKGRKIPVNGGGHEEGHPEPVKETTEQAQPEKDAAVLELEKARDEAKESQDKYLRLYAETENFKKRMAREASEREKFYNEGIIKELLPVLDNLDRAIAHSCEDQAGEGMAEGVKMVRKQFMDALAKFGVSPVESIGLPFDPAREQAIMQVETDVYEPGTVVEVFQKGYFLNDRILRPAMVTVAKKPAGE